MLRRTFLFPLLAALAGAGCSGTDQFSRHQLGDAPSNEKGNAIVVFGLNFRAPGGAPVHGVITVAWSSYDPASGRVLETNRFGATRTCYDPQLNAVPAVCEKNLTSYHVVEVKPGDYILSRGTVPAINRVYVTNFHEMPSWTNWSRSAAVGASTAPRFSVAAGEIVYIGDYFFFPFTFPVRPTGLEWHPDAARAHLAAMSTVRGPLIERRP